MFGRATITLGIVPYSSLCMKYLENRWTDLHQIHTQDVFGGPSLGRVWRSRLKLPGTKQHFSALSAACVRFMFGKTSLAFSLIIFFANDCKRYEHVKAHCTCYTCIYIYSVSYMCSFCLNPVYTIQPVVKPVVQPVWQPVECLYTRCNRLSIRFDNRFENGFDHRLYRVNGA